LPEHRAAERDAGLASAIGSTGSGTGAAVASRIARFGTGVIPAVPAEERSEFDSFRRNDVPELMANLLAAGDRLLIEGTQGFGLSIFHGSNWPKATARDTTAAGFLSECGLPPGETDQVIMVLRTYPIRVAGDSGPLVGEVTWEDVREWSGSSRPLEEFTSVTNKLRRVGRFDPKVVKRAIMANAPTHIVLNHLDYIDASIALGGPLTRKAADFVRKVESEIGTPIDEIGSGPMSLERMPSDGISR
jgi:adenylosuccinate synthase